MTDRLRSAAQRALESIDDLISNTTDPGVEALGARHQLATVLINTSPEQRIPCSLSVLNRGHASHWWKPQPGMSDVLCPGKAVPAEEPETDEQRTDRLETERDHAAGDHEHCGVTCEAEFPSGMLRNGILCRAIPGSATMLDELLRRAATARRILGGVEQTDTETVQLERGPLWSLLDWSLWGAGMGDTFREPLADTMLGAVPAETVAQAEVVMAEFIQRRQIEKTGVTVYQEQRAELDRLRAEVAGMQQGAERNAARCEYVAKAAVRWRKEADGRKAYGLTLRDRVAELETAGQARDKVLRIVTEVTTEANDIGGVDINDLVDRLAQAGFSLPDDEDES